MHSLLDRVRVMHMPNQGVRQACLELLRNASVELTILDPAPGGDEELITSFVAAVKKLQLQLGI